MAIPDKWGTGTLWGDGRLWVKPFGSNPYTRPVEQTPQRIAVEIAYSGGDDFYIDSLSLITRAAPQREQRYQAYFDASVGQRVSLEIGYSAGDDFRIDNLRVIGRALHKRDSA